MVIQNQCNSISLDILFFFTNSVERKFVIKGIFIDVPWQPIVTPLGSAEHMREKDREFACVCVDTTYVDQMMLFELNSNIYLSKFISTQTSIYVQYYFSIGHILRRNCLLQRDIEGKIKKGIEVTGRRGRRRRKLLDELKGRRGYSHLKEEALDRTMWRARFERGFEPVVRQTTK